MILNDIGKKLDAIIVEMRIMNKYLESLSLLPDVKDLAERRKKYLKK